jgi:pimeloyl-ACP methyl ester carboxylesterase
VVTAGIFAGLAAILAVLGLFQFLGHRKDARLFPPPGRIVDIGDRRLHARISGSGAPTVVFESGISASSISWTVLQPLIAKATTTVSYDRAGLGWSAPSRGRYGADRMLADLSALLEHLHVPPPFVLVGHSYGALLARLYAERNRQQVAGLVLIDPVLACEWAKPDLKRSRSLQAACLLSSWGGFLSRFGLVRLATAPLLRGSTLLPRLIGKASAGPAAGVMGRLAGEIGKLPRESWPIVRAHWCRPSNFRAMVVHLKALPSSFDGVRNAECDFPLVVISASNLSPVGLSEHRSIAELSSCGEHIVATHGGHWVHFDDPELVANAIDRVVATVRSRRTR